ncbi:hypothetical protein [Flavobacterium sp.]|jgi:hypothetical protein|uniref:hypothetical protein n=1 Tax=Flavobacterium sp. TaxID=239 RepID=UPI0037C161B2
MKLIAHRGLINGPDSNLENTPSQIELALSLGYDAEVDFWVVEHSSHNRYYLGHDAPVYEIEWEFIEQAGLWIHAKNIAALYLLGADNKLNFFWHENDAHTLTSQGYIWTYPEQKLTRHSIMLMPEWADRTLENTQGVNCYGICSDWVQVIRDKRLTLKH